MAAKKKAVKRIKRDRVTPAEQILRNRSKVGRVQAQVAREKAYHAGKPGHDPELDDLLGEIPTASTRTTSGRKASTMDLETKGLWLSVHQFCQETGKDRKSVDQKLRLGIITPIKSSAGHPLYKLRDLIDLVFYRDDTGKVDIDRLDPFRRKAHYGAELDKLKMLQQSGQLIPASEVEAEQARVAKILTQFLDTLPDIMERDCGASATMLAKIEQRIDAAREDLFKKVTEDEEPVQEKESLPGRGAL